MASLGSREYAAIVIMVAVLALLMALGFRTQDLLLAGLAIGLYGLHLVRIRAIRDRQERQFSLLREVGSSLSELYGRDPFDILSGSEPVAVSNTLEAGEEKGSTEDEGELVARELRLGTVAVVEGALEPEQVSAVLTAQEREPEKRFGELAVESGYLDRDDLETLLEVQERGLYERRRLERARRKLKTYLETGGRGP